MSSMNKSSRKEKAMNTTTVLSSEILRRAADLSDEIAAKQEELNQLLAGQITVTEGSFEATKKDGTKRHYSRESREKIRQAQLRRWRAVRKQAKQTAKTAEIPAVPEVPLSVPAPAPAEVPAVS